MEIKTNQCPYAIEMHEITKTFLNGTVIANKDVNLFVKKNEIHAIIGENGAGKSTLMSILFGIYKQDSGSIKINGRIVNFNSAKDASKTGIGMVHQHFKLIDTLSVLDNVILGSEGTVQLGMIRRKKIAKELKKIIQEYGLNINLKSKISKITVGQQQKTEILKLLYRDIDILIFDEPTAVLSEDEIQAFLQMLKDFKAAGKTIIVITHKLNEIKEVADSATVIRRGHYIDSFDVKEKTVAEMAELMVGRKLVEIKNVDPITSDEKVFEVKNLDIQSIVKKQKDITKVKSSPTGDDVSLLAANNNNLINFSIRKGEIFAIAGVEGNGQSELAQIISGLLKGNKEAKIILDNQEIEHASIKNRYRLGLSYVPEDRHKHGLVLDDTIAMNTILQQVDDKPYSSLGFFNNSEISKHAINIIKKYDVRGTTRGTSDARGLSGGNQQKLIIGREFERSHKLILLVQPTRGLDLGAIEFIHEQTLEEKRKGNAILLISYELDEILSLADTIAVIHNGYFISVGDRFVMTRQKIGELMAGEKI
ncbi:methylgalactoside permease ATP-binding protein [Ureaplasma urealyticum serovar 10 str. ATCC 33699]|uniref:Methylgalactoside permease ATP-binding protein n=1 Tax=Ureaplasma urealyticum serovar 10 (strain ATCC 33699 / Western) TaxID=565575 RepID=B5ZAI8_UREU1|nr:ABC transporter ATP-binding protein [Ureaplasma urealyticum]ACI59961.1 methylgalactoside permease ATP-binding protein [Ureaplasma urealyticum serovar 10 str. ATCC 33699]